MYCEKCGNEILDGASFCTSCGEPVNDSIVEQTTVLSDNPFVADK